MTFDALPQLAAGAEGRSGTENRQGAWGSWGGRGASYHISWLIDRRSEINSWITCVGGNDQLRGIWINSHC
jgi:hypothetical protein